MSRWQRLQDCKELVWGDAPSSFKAANTKRPSAQATAAVALQNLLQVQAIAATTTRGLQSVAEEREELRRLELEQKRQQEQEEFEADTLFGYGAASSSSNSLCFRRAEPYSSTRAEGAFQSSSSRFGSTGIQYSSLLSSSSRAPPPQEFQPLMDEYEDLQILEREDPELFAEQRVSELAPVHSSIRGGDQGSSFQLALPNKVNVEDRRKEMGRIHVNDPPVFFSEEQSKGLKQDISLAPDARHGQSSAGNATWEEAIKLASDFPLPDPSTHPAADGDTSEEEGAMWQQHVDLIQKDNFPPVVSGQMNRSTVVAYEKQYSSKYRPLLRGCGLSGKRKHVSPHSMGLLQRAFALCGDFPQSRHAYLSQIKGYVELTHPLDAATQKAYDRAFKSLIKTKNRSHQQRGFRASDMLLMANKVGASSLSRNTTVMLFKHGSTTHNISAEVAFRFMIVCWYAFLRPDDAAHTSRKCDREKGEALVTIHSSKTDQQGRVEAQAIFQCNCRSAPRAAIPLCPVCAMDDGDWDVMQRMMKTQADAKKKAKENRVFDNPEDELYRDGLDDKEDELYPSQVKWNGAIESLVQIAGIPNPRVGADVSRGRTGRLTWNTYSVRVGGAQSARDGGAEEDLVMALGRWLSPRVKEHYKGLAACLPDTVRIPWPIRKGHLFSEHTNFNTNSDWAAATALQLAYDI